MPGPAAEATPLGWTRLGSPRPGRRPLAAWVRAWELQLLARPAPTRSRPEAERKARSGSAAPRRSSRRPGTRFPDAAGDGSEEIPRPEAFARFPPAERLRLGGTIAPPPWSPRRGG